MGDILKFIGEHPWITFFLAYLFVHLVFKIINRFYRVINLWKNGWPPPHCDADGDFKPEPEKEIS